MIKISSLRRKADPLLIVSKRLPSYIKKEKIKLTRNSNVNKKNVKYYQVPHFVQELIKFTRKNKLWKEQKNENIMDINNNNDHPCYNNIINKNKIHYVNNLLNEIPKNKNLLTSYLICEIYGCLYKLNYLKLDIIFLLFSILINNTINFFNLSGYVNCNFKELINITKYIYHFQNVCNSNIQNILHKKPKLTELKIVQRYLKENNKEMKNKHGCYNYIYNYIQKYDHIDNIDILIYSLIKCKKDEKGYIYEKIKKKDIILDDENDITSNIRNISNMSNMSNMSNISNISNMSNMSNMSNISNISNMSNMSNISNIFPPAITNTSNYNNTLVDDNNDMDRLIDYINSFYKLNDMFNFLLNKILNYFNENSVNFDFHNLKLLFFFISKFEKFDTNLLENISNRLISEIEKMKTNPKLLDDEENSTNDPLEKNIVNHLNHNKIKRSNMYNKKMRYINTFNKINSKEFLILPYTIGLSMNRYFNNYLIEYINIYILSLINSRVNCDIQTFIYTLIGYRHIMVNFFILYNIFLFKEKCFQNENLLKKYKFFLNKLIHYDIQNMNQISSNKIIKIKNHMMNNKIKSEQEINQMNHNKYINVLNLEDTKHTINHLNLDQKNISLQSVKEQDLHNIYYTSSKNELKINQKNIFDLLIKEFHINLEKIMLINFDKNSLYQQYTSKDIYHFFITYKKLFQKVYNYSIFLLDKHNINDMLTIYQHIKAHSLNDIIINHIFIETLYNKIILNSVPKKN
ncbi:conserved Plasmodium protein, unknown function [Plasmodium sp. gorilla clade G2]|uniref:conserved Plasmodium protein, unknown function n=1 Tax=Plasmodium sp. gorilla clade G2 TaxID=880535 RepID=UPI000D207434|nr:conserved Plasmodium protein, unknown function [Plasmodium sp. gorilla clade G2]SOV14766.1 conserved Plasmodium protein, unknown function [Plasmodium sp. gorilla clade G2]